ncbi:MAG: YncE family protein [Lysinibacillus sp.]
MHKWIYLVLLLLLVGCSDEKFDAIEPTESFVATVNILQPSLQFFNEQGELFTEWTLDEAYSGATLVKDDFVLLYGNQLTEAHLYELSSGRLIHTIATPIGTTNGYYDEESDQIFLTNSETNKLYVFNQNGEEIGEIQMRNYPMSMIAFEGHLFVVNYKDTILSIVDSSTLKVVDEWPIESSSHGLWVDTKNERLWIGGHGAGTKANDRVKIFNLKNGKIVNELIMPMMPVAIAGNEKQQAVVSHGSNMLYTIVNESIVNEQKIAANPFAVAYFNEQIVIAGYDDATLYFIEQGQTVNEATTNKGPFQLLTREDP